MRHRQQAVRHRPVGLQHGVLVGTEQHEPLRHEVLEREQGLRASRRERAWSVHPDEGDALGDPAVEIGPHLVVDTVLDRHPRVLEPERARALRGRQPVVGVEVPAPALGLAVVVDEQSETPTLMAVEVLHHRAAVAEPCLEVVLRHGEPAGGQHGHPALAHPPTGRVRRGLDDADRAGVDAGDAEGLAVRRGAHVHSTVAELGGTVAQRTEQKVRLLPMRATTRERGGRLDQQHLLVRVEVVGEVRAELVGEQHPHGTIVAPAPGPAPRAARRGPGKPQPVFSQTTIVLPSWLNTWAMR